ncbi:DEAD/DEAH box helicase family protein [Streptomyces sp. CAU 1734]|uniref:EcoAI/FtnUII family type I restriction enzme subunit R n=1 Tax=Streptomyces sp. CAU 1734 TaxID=3140360 RepID=UPI003261CBE7
MSEPDKTQLTEAEIRTRYVTPALSAAGWPLSSLREEFFYFSAGRIQVVGKKSARKAPKRVDYLLEYRPNLPVAVVEAKDNRHAPGDGMQQAIQYAEQLDVPSVFTTNGDSFVWHDRTGLRPELEVEIPLDQFPSPEALYDLYKRWRGIADDREPITATSFYDDGSGRRPRYYQRVAINRALEAIVAGQRRLLLVMATGTGKTYTAAQIIWRFMEAYKKINPTKAQARILFLADRNILIDQTMMNDFTMFKGRMAKLSTSHKTIKKVSGSELPELGIASGKVIDKSYELYLSLYQAVTGAEDIQNIYKQFSPNFFDLIIVDECHRGSARADSAWRDILDYFSTAIQLGMTATPKETKTVSNIDYFGDPIYTYSLRQGIEDGYLAPYKVIRIATDVDTFGYRPAPGEVDDTGEVIPDKEYGQKDFDRTIVLPERDKRVAERLTEYLKNTDRFAKTIVFCVDIDHANRMRRALANLNREEVIHDSRYIMQITGDDQQGKAELDNFIDPESRYPVITTTSKLLSTGVDAQTCKVIVLDSKIESMTDFKQMIGRGTRVRTDYDKWFFVILDFRNVTRLFADPDFDGDPVKIIELPLDGGMDEATEDLDEVDEAQETDDDKGSDIRVEMPGKRKAKQKKLIVGGQQVTIIGERVQLIGADGKLITESLKDFTKRNVLGEYATLDEFLTAWSSADQRSALLDEMADKGIPIDDLLEQVGAELDPFDLILHIAYDRRPLRRRDRAGAVRASSYMTKYQGKAREVIEALLDKYSDSGIRSVEDIGVLRVDPFRSIGTPMEIIQLFGSRETFQKAVRDLERELYQEAA